MTVTIEPGVLILLMVLGFISALIYLTIEYEKILERRKK